MDIKKNMYLTDEVRSEAERRAEQICQHLNVMKEFHYVQNNNSSTNLPYHNWYHTCCMVRACFSGANYHNLPYRSVRHLIVAALFHDIAHSGGKHPDHYNIAQAVQAVRTVPFVIPPEINREAVADLIHVTEYPFRLTPRGIDEKILRDADLMQSLSPGWYDMTVKGLREEMRTAGRTLTIQEMIAMQATFLSEATFYTRWAQDRVVLRIRDLAIDLRYHTPQPEESGHLAT